MKKVDAIKEAARASLAMGADPHLARKIYDSEVDDEKVLERRFVALLNTVPDDNRRRELAQMVWGGWNSQNVRVGMSEEEWARVEAALERFPGRSKAEKLGKLILLGVSLLEEEGPKALTRLL